MAIVADVERFAAMGTRIELHVFGRFAEDGMRAARMAIEAVDDALTIHRPSPTTALNDALLAQRDAVVDDALLLEALAAVDVVHRDTGGLFDPAADVRLPGSGWNAIAFEPATARIRAVRPLALDFGGIGKGLALDRACTALRAAGVQSACLSAGESSLAVIGEHPLGGKWPFAVPHPVRSHETLVELALEDEALSISSTAGASAPERAPTCHPADGRAVTAARTAVAIDPLGGKAEAMSTALLVADDGQAQRLMRAAPGRRFLFDLFPEAAMPARHARMRLR